MAAFAVAAISVILSPTPQGVGVVEAAIAAILTAHGCSLATATAIALVYRGIMFWVPFCIGALLLSQSGFFADKKSPTEEQRAKDTAWVLGTLVLIVGLVNMGLALIPQTFEPFMALTEWINMGGLLIGPALIVGSVVLIVLAVGLILRFRTAWALTLGVLVLLAGAEFLYVNTVQVAVAALVLLCLLFWKRDAFDRPIVPRDDAPRLVSEFHENLDRFHAWNEARKERAASGEGEDVRTGRGATLAARRAERRDQGRAKRKTGWEQRAEKGAEISRQAQREGILPFGEDVVVSPRASRGCPSPNPHQRKRSRNDSAR
ncbi:lysylphosphatidylglycerol synthase transmembrane domain-containing protein [Eggerthella sinensis]|uniref:lysylphosphatidylglycerol synthase transmembrane domain-containing protein n=1 Tax=Eggerthella sinensis TaxID=242230 RepID=UPI0022E19434|nr:lysylphosphatidylglycerol synthase domain-containing protein [Eggerthella sinensis]